MVGILALPNYFDGFTGRSYIAASYVKWVEARLHGFDKRPNKRQHTLSNPCCVHIPYECCRVVVLEWFPFRTQ